MEDRGFPTLYPSRSGDPNIVTIRMNDPAIKTDTRTQLCFTEPYLSEQMLFMLSKLRPSSNSSVIDSFGFVPTQHFAAEPLETGPKLRSPHKGIICNSSEALIFGDPDPNLCYVPSPQPVDSALPPPMTYEESKAKAASIRARLAAATAEIEASSARRRAAAPAIPRYWDDPSNKKASEAAATSTPEGQAEAGGPVLKRARQDLNPSAADSSATGSRNN